MMGSLGSAQWRDVARLAVVLAIAGPALLHWARDLDALSLGHDAAAALGVPPEAASRKLYLTASLLAAATVAAAAGSSVSLACWCLTWHGRWSNASSGLAGRGGARGSTLVVGADLAARTVRAPAELR
jgi:iron complex transport system permease protein